MLRVLTNSDTLYAKTVSDLRSPLFGESDKNLNP